MVLFCKEKGMGDFTNIESVPTFRIGKKCEDRNFDLFNEGNKVGRYDDGRNDENKSTVTNGIKKFIPYNANKLSFFGEISKFQFFDNINNKVKRKPDHDADVDKRKESERKNFFYESDDTEDVQYRNGVTGKYVQGKFGGKYVTGNSKYVNDESGGKREYIKGKNPFSKKFIQGTIYGKDVSESVGLRSVAAGTRGKSDDNFTKSSSSDVISITKKQEEDEVSLFPLQNQVGGHTRLLLLNQSTICKPLNPRELDFYRNLPRDIQIFVPEYKGESFATLNFRHREPREFSKKIIIQFETGRKFSDE
mgnify:FL=1